MKQNAMIVDIDGTVALKGDRNPYDYETVGDDKPNQPITALVGTIAFNRTHDVQVIFVSGRMEQCRYQTQEWLNEHLWIDTHMLHMRADNDYRPDDVVKEEIYRNKIEPHFNVLWVFDDRDKVVAMWRRIGLTCLQVAEGDF